MEFFSAQISNPHTRRAYARAVSEFLSWCEAQGLEQLPGEAANKNQALAGLRHFFDALVRRHAAILNPFQSVRGVRNPFGDGKTPEVTVEQARQLLASIDTGHVFGLRDRAVLGTLIYTGARVGAIARLRIQDLRDQGDQRSLLFTEKIGKAREIPVRHDLDKWISAYIEGAGLPEILSPHSFRFLVVTDLLSQNVPLEDVQYLAGHAHPRTSQIYDRRRLLRTRCLSAKQAKQASTKERPETITEDIIRKPAGATVACRVASPVLL